MVYLADISNISDESFDPTSSDPVVIMSPLGEDQKYETYQIGIIQRLPTKLPNPTMFQIHTEIRESEQSTIVESDRC